MHLTLRFLGNVATEHLDELSRRLRVATASFGALHLRCERLGCFPDLRYPRVVWTWVHDTEERLAQLHRCVEAAVGCFAEKPAEAHFVGHVTLARPKQINRADARQLAEFVESAVNRQFGTWECREAELVRSELSPSGSRYTTLDVFPL